MIQADDRSTVWIAEDNLSTHINKFVYEEETTLEHLLVDKHRALSLRSNNQEDRQQIGCKTWPWSIGNGHNRTIDKALDAVVILLWNVDIIATLLETNTHTSELRWDDAQVVVRYIRNGKLRAVHCRHTDKATHLDHIWQHSMLRATQ